MANRVNAESVKASAKVLEDKVVISSQVLTDENLNKVSILNPSVLVLKDEEGTVLYEVASSEYNTFNRNGASFKGGKSHTNIQVDADEDKVKEIIKAEVTGTLMKLHKIETQVTEYINSLDNIEVDIDFIEG